MINFIAAVKTVYKNILFKKEGQKYIGDKTVNFSDIIKKCCVSKKGLLKYKNQIGAFLLMTHGLVGWSVDDRRIIIYNKNDRIFLFRRLFKNFIFIYRTL